MKKADPNPKANRNILKLVYVIVALFLGLIAYMAYFLQVRGEDVINNSYNARLDSFADRIIRGKILAADGTVQIDKSKCIGCQFCAMACPYGVLKSDRIEHKEIMKCDMCVHRSSDGSPAPMCVEICPMKAITMEEVEA